MRVPDLAKDTHFTQDLTSYASDKKHYLDESGNLIKYTTTDTLEYWKNIRISIGKSPMSDLDISGGNPIPLSNSAVEFGATMIQDLNWGQIGWRNPNKSRGPSLLRVTKPVDLTYEFGTHINPNEFLMKGELTGPLAEAVDEQGSEEETDWFCKGCTKYFATKASLKRHHERKKSCKELCESTIEPKITCPDAPYIVDWVDKLIANAISGNSEGPYCKHCDVEFANKSNLNKHLTKSVACDKLAKQEFMKLILSKKDRE
jgi:hypothetical protein